MTTVGVVVMCRRMVLVLLLAASAAGQELPDGPLLKPVSFVEQRSFVKRGLSANQRSTFKPASISKQDLVTFSGLGAEIAADGVTTRILYQRRYKENDPLARPFVQAGVPGQVAASLLAAGALGGTWWALHRSHRDRMARYLLWSAAAVEGGNDARQFAILRGSGR